MQSQSHSDTGTHQLREAHGFVHRVLTSTNAYAYAPTFVRQDMGGVGERSTHHQKEIRERCSSRHLASATRTSMSRRTKRSRRLRPRSFCILGSQLRRTRLGLPPHACCASFSQSSPSSPSSLSLSLSLSFACLFARSCFLSRLELPLPRYAYVYAYVLRASSCLLT